MLQVYAADSVLVLIACEKLLLQAEFKT